VNWPRHWWGLTAIGLLLVVLVSLSVAPAAPLRDGSTYSRSPSGYGAWYAYMQAQGSSIQRWQQPIEQLPGWPQPKNQTPAIDAETIAIADGAAPAAPMTLLQIGHPLEPLTSDQQAWIQQGNTLIQLGVESRGPGFDAPVTPAPFRSVVPSATGPIKLQTSRRLVPLSGPDTPTEADLAERLSDAYGAIVLQQNHGTGRWMGAVTPYLAANAYQVESGNFKFLQQLVAESGHPIWVDEYLHGYSDAAISPQPTPQTVLNYLAKTPLLLLALQAIVFLAVLFWGLNHRFGPAQSLVAPPRDNSEAYIQALALVLEKANCREFVVETIGKAEQRHLQRALGLGDTLLDPASLAEQWRQQTGRSNSSIETVFRTAAHHRRLSQAELMAWLAQLYQLRQQLLHQQLS
jgi:hypothetical protein